MCDLLNITWTVTNNLMWPAYNRPSYYNLYFLEILHDLFYLKKSNNNIKIS